MDEKTMQFFMAEDEKRKNHPNPAAAPTDAIRTGKGILSLSKQRIINSKKNAADSARTAAVLPQKRAHNTAAENDSEKTASVLILSGF